MKKVLVTAFALLIILLLILTIGVKTQKNIEDNSKIKVIASFYPLYFFAKEIGGDLVSVENITPAGAEPHDYEPSTSDMANITNSKLLILNGGGLESWKITDKSIETVIAYEGDDPDPHIWLSPQLAEKIADKIALGLMKVDPKNSAVYGKSLANLKNRLDNLDYEYRNGLNANTCEKKDFITSHSAFHYIASTYGFNQISISGLSPDSEPTPKELADITDFARAQNIKYIFTENLISPKLAETLANEIGAKTLVLNPLEGLTAEEISRGENYFTVMRENLINLETALQCKK
ncbi:MAG: zinc ABC transporter substrate-binding protein [Candidatus Taylorbacteria bacterium]|nr:zinc ABC transporter substrate-binding protein [Candidatus Taylorbacteria bacterium]